VTGKLIRITTAPGSCRGRGSRGDYFLPARLRAGQYARRDRPDGAAHAIHGRRGAAARSAGPNLQASSSRRNAP